MPLKVAVVGLRGIGNTHAAAYSKDPLAKLVAVCKDGDDYPVLSPCGNCRQLVFDYSPDAMVILDLDGRVVKTEARNLLPGAYKSGFDEH